MNGPMTTLEAASPLHVDEGRAMPSMASAAAPRLLEQTLGSLGIENRHRWAWDNYKHVVENLCAKLGAKHIIEIGGGRDPLFTVEEIERLGVEMTVNDISAGELAVLPKGYKTACFDVAGDISAVANLRGTFDLAFSRMVFEHVADGKRAWSNLYELLAPGGVALAFIPTLYALPFIINLMLPDKLAAAIVKMLFANRTDDEDPVFPARYSWCFTDDRLRRMLMSIGYREAVVVPFYGHDYYESFPVIRDVNGWFTKLARRHKTMVGQGTDSKTGWHRQVNPVPDFPQVGHLTAHLIGHIFIHFCQRNDQFVTFRRLMDRKLAADMFLYFSKPLVQFFVLSRRQFVQVLNDLKHIRGNGSAVGPDKRHAKRAIAIQCPFHFGHHLKGFIIGVQ